MIYKKTLRKIISIMLAFEAVVHFVFPAISLYGMYKEGIWDALILLTPVADLVFGVVCTLGSYLLGEKHHH